MANLIHNFLPCVMVVCHLISLFPWLNSDPVGTPRLLMLDGNRERTEVSAHWLNVFLWTNGDSDLFKGIKAKNLSPSVCFVSVYSSTTILAHSFTSNHCKTSTLPVGIYIHIYLHKHASDFLFLLPLQTWDTVCGRSGSSSQQWDLWSRCGLQCQDWRYSLIKISGLLI